MGLADLALLPRLGPVGALAQVEGASGPLASGAPWEGAVATDVKGLGGAILALALGTLLLHPVANIVPDLGLGAVRTDWCHVITGTGVPGVLPCGVVARLVPVGAVREREVLTEVPASRGEGEEGGEQEGEELHGE